MEGYWSLTFFTVFAQVAAGMVMLKAVFGSQSQEKRPCWLMLAIGLLGVATIMSLFHLAAPFSAYYTITNVWTSWLSREILTVSLFGILLVLYAVKRKPYLLCLAALASLLMIYSMAKVYMVQPVIVWDTWLTFVSFFATAMLLGSATLFVLDLKEFKSDDVAQKAILRGWQPIIIATALGVQLVAVSLQLLPHNINLHLSTFVWQYVLSLAGGILGFVGIIHGSTALKKQQAPHLCLFWLALALVWGGAICGRILFYNSYTYFGM